jgi:hypothetical protein
MIDLQPNNQLSLTSRLLIDTDDINFLSISKSYAYCLMRSGKIKILHLGDVIRVWPKDFIRGYMVGNSTPRPAVQVLK